MKRGPAEESGQWRQNSFRAYVYGEAGQVHINVRQQKTDRRDAAHLLKLLVEAASGSAFLRLDRMLCELIATEHTSMSAEGNEEATAEKKLYVTLSGLPLRFHLEWPFHKSTSGADFWVLHGDIRLENSDGLHALVAVNLSATVKEVMPSLEPKAVEAPVINALRREVDRKQLEFLKSGKLLPVHFSSRHYDFKRNKWVFGRASDDDMMTLVARKAYWQTRLDGGPVWLGDLTEALYVETTPAHVLEIAQRLAGKGLIKLQDQYATANPSLMAQAEKFESEMRQAVRELEKKHEFERG